MNLKKSILLLTLAFLVFSCDEKESATPNEISLPLQVGIEGYIQKGPFTTGTIVTIQELDEDFVATGVIHTVTIDNDLGFYKIHPTIGTKHVDIIASGKYFNEITGQVSYSDITLRSIVEIEKQINANINVLSTVSRKRIIYLINSNGLSFKEARRKAEQEVLNLFGISSTDVTPFNDMDISKNNVSGAILLAISSILQNNSSSSELMEIITKISIDIESDGLIESSNKQLLIDKSRFIKTGEIRSRLTERYNQQGLSVTLPNFEDYTMNLLLTDITSNLIAYYPCDQDMNDASGHENHAEGVQLNHSQDLNGANNASFSLSKGSYIKFPKVIDVVNDKEWTYTLWIKINNLNEFLQILLGLNYGNVGWPVDVPFYFGSTSKTLFSYDGAVHKGTQTLSTDTWYHIALVFLENKGQIYLNGEVILSIDYLDFDYPISNYYLSGATYDNKDAYFDGNVDEIRFYKRALNNKEINMLYSDHKNN